MPPAYAALTDLTAVKQAGNINSSASDTNLTALIAAVSAVISNYCNRNFVSASYTESYNGNGNAFQWLKQRPVTAVANVTMNGYTVPQRPNVNGYGWTFDQNKLYFSQGCWDEGFQNVTVTYTAGIVASSSLTPDLWRAAAEWVADLYKSEQHIEKGSDTTGQGQSTVYLKDMPWHVRQVVDLYRQVATEQVLGN